jgi:thioredoxin-related protein
MGRLLALLLVSFACAAGAAEPWERFFQPSLGDLRAEADEAQKAGKQGLLVMYQFKECPYCAAMKRAVLSRVDVQDAFRAKFAAIEVDTRGSNEIVGFDGRAMAEKDFARANRIPGAPVFVFYGFDGQVLKMQVGPVNDAPTFMALGDYVASGAYRQVPFEVYVRSHRKGG